ncbi:SMC-Scp complex subunit ScpB [Roseomonas sp. CCTCC AB2023176]|uniref:SMC-Scp complex subunit ScpB n=1 Tax=Roseomonas sp. CCTCC AB2023176 TaxID=3342640 RepID=UPI0035DB9D85
MLPDGVDPRAVLHELAARSAERGVVLTQVAGGWAFRTAPDLAPLLTKVVEVPRRLPRAAMEALAIVAWHQPVTRPEIEEIRGTSLAQTTLEILLENGLIAPRGKKEAPGRPTLWGTTPRFLDQFGLNSLRDLPRREELLPEPGLPFPAPAALGLPTTAMPYADGPPRAADDGGAQTHRLERDAGSAQPHSDAPAAGIKRETEADVATVADAAEAVAPLAQAEPPAVAEAAGDQTAGDPMAGDTTTAPRPRPEDAA